jgi:hypothetical protein
MANNRGTRFFGVPIRFDLQKSFCDWRTVTGNDGDRCFQARERPGLHEEEQFTEGWDLVRRFLSIDTNDENAILDFLEDTGYFGSPIVADRPRGPDDLQCIPKRAFRMIQDYIRNVLLKGDPTLSPPWEGGRIQNYVLEFKASRFGPQAEISVGGTRAAIFALVQFKIAQGGVFKTCARKDCRLPFEVTSRHKRRFCTHYCAHITSLRKRRNNGRQGRQRGGQR